MYFQAVDKISFNSDVDNTEQDESTLIFGLCKAHYNTDFSEVVTDGDKLHMDHFQPYGDFLPILHYSLSGVEVVPQDLPKHLGCLQVMQLKDADDLKSLPATLSQLFKLKSITVRKQNQLTALPSDIGDCQSLIDLVCYRSLITELPTSMERCITLQHLSVHSSRLKTLPQGFGQMKNLVYLDISHNPLTQLPAGFGNLKSLKTLKYSGQNYFTSYKVIF